MSLVDRRLVSVVAAFGLSAAAAWGARPLSGFQAMDADRDGRVTPAEHAAAAAKMFDAMDANKDGKVTAAEYKAPVLANFDKADTNKDGVLSQAERQPKKK